MNFLTLFSRLNIQGTALTNILNVARPTITAVVHFRTTPYVMAEPLKKKKRVDPAVIKAREDRKKRRIEKQIRRLEKNARQLKPIEECEVPLVLLEERSKRERSRIEIPVELERQRILLQKYWANYKRKQHLETVQMIDRISYMQQRALDELRKESEELYQEAIQPDFHTIPFKTEGPRETPAIANYDAPDGDYADLSKKWEN